MEYLESAQHRNFHFDPPSIRGEVVEGSVFPPMKFEVAGEEKFDIEDVAVELFYEIPTRDNVSPEKFAQLEKYKQVDNFRVVRSLKLSNKDRSVVLDLNDLVPVGTNMLIDVNALGVSRLNNYNSKNNTITVGKDLRTAEGLVTLLHEVGHARTQQNGEGGFTREQLDEATFYRQFLRSNDDASEIPQAVLETILKDERFAWEFAIKSLRPFLNADSGSSFNEDSVKHYASEWLSSYFRRIPEHSRTDTTKLVFDAKSPHE